MVIVQHQASTQGRSGSSLRLLCFQTTSLLMHLEDNIWWPKCLALAPHGDLHGDPDGAPAPLLSAWARPGCYSHWGSNPLERHDFPLLSLSLLKQKYMCVCVYICVYLYIYVFINIFVYMCFYIYLYVYIYICVYINAKSAHWSCAYRIVWNRT